MNSGRAQSRDANTNKRRVNTRRDKAETERDTTQTPRDNDGLETVKVHWFPGHMAKAQRMISENMRLVDIVCEIVDARIPRSSRNPDVVRLRRDKPHMVILNRTDQADPEQTKRWREWFKSEGLAVLETDSRSGRGVSGFAEAARTVLAEQIERWQSKGQWGRPVRAMVLGIPNVGKSAFINKVAGRKAAIAADRPGVTRGKQWISVEGGVELLDTPGILAPRFDRAETGEFLAFCGAVRDEILDLETLAANLMLRLSKLYPGRLEERYGLTAEGAENGFELLERAAQKRGFLLGRGEFDTERMARALLDEFRGGKLGRITLERPDDLTDNDPAGAD